VIGTTRRRSRQIGLTLFTIDMRAVRKADWIPLLKGIDAVVNCVGVLQDNAADSTEAAHFDGPSTLFAACEEVGVRKVIHFSAIGMDRDPLTEFSRSKARGDATLMTSSLDWIILRPSVVVGGSAYGGSALFRGLAALPLLPRLPMTGQLQIVQLADVVSTVLFFLRNDSPTCLAIELAGPERLAFEDVIDEYRLWMGKRPARRVRLPPWAMRAVYSLGDFAVWLGWRPPIRSTAAAEMGRGATGDPTRWIELTGIKPEALRQALRSSPASVQERWFSRLYLLKPVIFTLFSLFWIATAFMSLGPGWEIGINLLHEGGVTGVAAPLTVIAGALADLAIGLGIAWRWTARPALHAAFVLSLAYVVIGALLVPRLWIDPLGPMLKILPVLALNMTAIAILEDR
jgi:uncharacterized protein YbjT (DUF2867 family)